jgi:guanylate kinase
MLCITGPSGVGKGTLISLMTKEFPHVFGFAVSHTTRAKREGEVHGKHYYFVSREEMAQRIGRGDFLETAVVHGNVYGTSRQAVAELAPHLAQICLLDLDVQGLAQVKRALPATRAVGIVPPSMQVLGERLRGRGSESAAQIELRLANAAHEITLIPGLVDAVIVNQSSWEQGYPELRALVVKWFGLQDGSSRPKAEKEQF